MKIVCYVLLGFILMLLESSLSSRLAMDLFKPDFVAPLVIYTTLFVGPGPGLIATLCVSLMQESLSGTPTGAIMFAAMVLFLVTAFMNKQLYIDSKYSFASVCFAAVLFQSVIFLLLSFLAKGEVRNIYGILVYAVPNAVVTGFISVPLYVIIEHINRRFLDREQA